MALRSAPQPPCPYAAIGTDFYLHSATFAPAHLPTIAHVAVAQWVAAIVIVVMVLIALGPLLDT